MNFQLDSYLKHIAIKRPEPNAEDLAQLQQAQLRAITFENIDPLLGKVPSLKHSALTKKLLTQGRGGYCLELNSLLGLALQALGFEITPLLARVHMGRTEGGPRSHLAFLVQLNEESWLLDAGFGGPAPPKPLLLNTDKIQQQGHDRYRIQQNPTNGETLVEKQEEDDWLILYSFDKARVNDSDLEAANFICSSWSEAPITQHLIMYRQTEQGRVSLIDTTFTKEHNGVQTTQEIDTPEALYSLIETVFEIKLSAEQLHGLALKLELTPA